MLQRTTNEAKLMSSTKIGVDLPQKVEINNPALQAVELQNQHSNVTGISYKTPKWNISKIQIPSNPSIVNPSNCGDRSQIGDETEGARDCNKSREISGREGLPNPVRMQLSYPQTEDERESFTNQSRSDSLTYLSSYGNTA